MSRVKIGKVVLDSPYLLAPMEAVTNSIFRRVVKPFGASLVFTEFCSSDGLLYGRDQLWKMVRFHESERPIAIQIFGSNAEVMAECAKRMEDLGADILDINCGCSVPKMGKSGSGAYLTRDDSKLSRVMEAVKKAVSIPVTIKVRKGWDENRITSVPIARMAEALGFSAVTVHGRTSVQAYSGKADWEAIDAVARSVRIPVIGSGDITSIGEADHRLRTTAVSAVMIGRGVMGKPWVFTGANPSASEKKSTVMNHLDLACEEWGETSGAREARKHLNWYFRESPHAASFRARAGAARSRTEIRSLIEAFYA